MNPILPPQFYIPDVEARQWDDGIVYLYGSSDRGGENAYCSHEYHVFGSEDMKHWTVYSGSFRSENVHRLQSRTVPLYAPDCEKIGDKYCLFYCQGNGDEGVAYSDTPYGPFRNAQGIWPADTDGIDPAILVDDDGSLYYFWGQYHAKGGKLDLETGKLISDTITKDILTEEEHGFHEGISIRKRNGIYYLIYSDISRGRPTCLGYAVSEQPLGPYKKGGIIIDNTGCDPKSWNNHGSIARINGEWYVFYHRSTHNSHFSRQVCAEPILFNEDGTIDEVEMTTQGIEGPLDCFRPLDAYRGCRLEGGCYIDARGEGEQHYEYIAHFGMGNTVTYKYLFFPERPCRVMLEASGSGDGAAVEVYLDGREEKPVAKIALANTAGEDDFQKFSGFFMGEVDGNRHSLHLRLTGARGTNLETYVCLKTICFEAGDAAESEE